MQNTDSPAETVVERIKAVMAERQITGVELARRLGFTQAYISRRLTGEVDFRMAELTAVAEALGVPLSQFIPASPARVA